jgi:hypothetical protein
MWTTAQFQFTSTVLHHTSWQNSAEESSTTVPFIPISGFWFLDAVLVLKIFVLYNFSTTCSEGTVLVSFSNPCRDNPLFFSNACAFYSCSIRFYGFAQIFPFCLLGIFTFLVEGVPHQVGLLYILLDFSQKTVFSVLLSQFVVPTSARAQVIDIWL